MNKTGPSRNHNYEQELTSNDIIDQLNIRFRVCRVFIEDAEKNRKYPKKNDKICQCGLRKSKHKAPQESLEKYWTMPYNTFETVNAAHGQLPNEAPFVQLAPDTPLEKVEKILLEAWKIPKPQFIVSIIGGAKYFKLHDRLETHFINGIVDIAQKSNVWLITTGYHVGIAQIVGQAINKVKLTKPEKKITAIGIGKWGCVTDVENVTRQKNGETTEETTDPSNHSRKGRVNGEWHLEMNHSHYLMLDDGTIRQFDIKDYRTRLAIHMARLQNDNDFVVPVVTIVAEGGKDTIANVYYDLQENIPVVLVNGSGRAADFLTRWLLYTKDLESDVQNREIFFGSDQLDIKSEETSDPNENEDNKPNVNHPTTESNNADLDSKSLKLEKIFKKYKEQIKTDLKDTLSSDKDILALYKHPLALDKFLDGLARQVMYCLQPAVRSDITVFNLNSDSDLSETIFRSICLSRQKLSKRRANERNNETYIKQKKIPAEHIKQWKRIELQHGYPIDRKDQNAERFRLLQLAMDWDCIDVAKEFILQNSLDNILNKNQAFKTALTQNRPKFVYEFLRLKIDPYEIFFSKNKSSQNESQYKKFIRTLYTFDAVNNSPTHLKYFIKGDKSTPKKTMNSVETLNKTLSSLIGDYMHKLYFDSSDKEHEDRIKKGLRKNPKETAEHKSEDSEANKSLLAEGKTQTAHDYIMRDLFLWAILMNYIDMAKVLLSHMKYRICPALIATKILKQYYQKATYGKLKYSYLESANYFEQYAITCLDKCDDHDVDQACEIILQRNELYGYVTCLQVAADAQDELFIATPCCVEAVNNIWYDKLRPEQKREGDKAFLFLGIISLGLAAPVLVSYRKTKKEIKKIEPSKYRSNGIDYCDPSLLEYYIRPASQPAYERYFPKLNKFHQSPLIKFCYHLINYIFFLLLFSYVLLFNFEPPTGQTPSIHWTEILTILLVSCLLIEEIHYFFRQDSLSWSGRFKNYFRGLFKIMTSTGFVLFYIGLIVRFTYADSEENFTAARIIMAFDLEIWWLRSLSFITVIPLLGPHLVAIGKMLKDLVFFMCIIAIVMAGYGVASRSMVYYPKANRFTTATGGPIDTSFDGRSVFHQIVYPVYYLMYGELDTELANLDSNPNAGWSIATQVLLAMHMLFVNILLTNLLIAMFSKRFQQVYDDTKNIWHSQKHFFTHEYYTRSPFIPPISLIYDIYHLSRMFFFFIRRKVFHKPGDCSARVFQIISKNDSTIKEWHEFENSSTYEYAHEEVKTVNTVSKTLTHGSDSSSIEKQEDRPNKENGANNTVDDLKQLQDDLITLNSMIEAMKGDLQKKRTEAPGTQTDT